ncbi:MAG: amino acid ABC transporter permease [Desulfobacterales bacterium]|nr:amino acid ABC transporter permease [Desulfobacterales bacterium]
MKNKFHKLIGLPLADILKFLAAAGFIIWLMYRGTEKTGYNWQWYRVFRYVCSFDDGRFVIGPLLDGLIVTVRITVYSLVAMFFFGLLSALFRLSDSFLAKILARGYIELIRNTPLLVQLFFIYFVISPVLDIGRFTSAVLALSLFEGAYASEIFRAGIVSIHKSQWEAAYSQGFTGFQTCRFIIFPQAVRRILPPLTGQSISLLKDSALVSTIAIYDLTMQGQAIISETYLTFEIWFVLAGIYLVLAMVISMGVQRLEKRFKVET